MFSAPLCRCLPPPLLEPFGTAILLLYIQLKDIELLSSMVATYLPMDPEFFVIWDWFIVLVSNHCYEFSGVQLYNKISHNF